MSDPIESTACEEQIRERIQLIDNFAKSYLHQMSLPSAEAVHELRRSMTYSATNGGKRFRPILSLLVAELLSAPLDRVLPFALAVELVHTYSLIHDDLPCMDNDDLRRGKPTNHKVFGEDFALLAGDALLTEAFLIIAESYSEAAGLVPTLTRLLSEAAGIRGMVGGQAIDLRAGKRPFNLAELTELHLLKTGALIRVAVEGAAVIAGADQQKRVHLRKFGEGLGLAFQVADDILDHGEKGQDLRSFTGLMGVDQAKLHLDKITLDTLSELADFPADDVILLKYLIQFNRHRKA